MSEIAIKIEHLGKRYRIGSTAGYKTIRESLMNVAIAPFRRRHSNIEEQSVQGQKYSYIWAVKDVSLEIGRGQAVGIIGKNGSGKSTLLKILSRITRPTEGHAEIHGRVASLLEVGTGFHPELTGRENINLNAAVLGMTRAEVKRQFEAIIDFAGETVRNFIDTPVKRYSSGMYVRLAFAIAAHLNTDVLLVDEVLAVGDGEFQKKCLDKMEDVAKSGKTVIFVSHNMLAVNKLCDRIIYLESGKVKTDKRKDEAIAEYNIPKEPEKKQLPLLSVAERADRSGDGRIRFLDLRWETADGQTVYSLKSGIDYKVVLPYKCPSGQQQKNVLVSLGIKDTSGGFILLHQTEYSNQNFNVIPPEGCFVCQIPKLPLPMGDYSVDIYIEIEEKPCDLVLGAAKFTVEAGDYYGNQSALRTSFCKFLVKCNWELLH